VLRIEDTDVERSTPEAVQAIIEGMVAGPGPTKVRSTRCSAWTATAKWWRMLARHGLPLLLVAGRSAAMRERSAPPAKSRATTAPGARNRARPCRPFRPAASRGALQEPAGRRGELDDVVKGTITIANKELDDLVIARPDGTPTYNFCVAIDDWTWDHARLRGDDHVNNTPRQINILRAIGAPLPVRPPADDPGFGRRRCPSAATPSASCSTRRRASCRKPSELPGAPGLEPRRRRSVLDGAGSSGSTSTTCPSRPPSSTSKSSTG
jgi:hypothetical protein